MCIHLIVLKVCGIPCSIQKNKEKTEETRKRLKDHWDAPKCFDVKEKLTALVELALRRS